MVNGEGEKGYERSVVVGRGVCMRGARVYGWEGCKDGGKHGLNGS